MVGQTHYHPKCFTCTDCKEPLGTSKYYIINGKNYCGKCRAKFLENCTKCGKMIENETIRPKETGKPYCPECFCCTKCDIPLQGKYFNTEDGILCEECFAVRNQKLSKLAVHCFARFATNTTISHHFQTLCRSLLILVLVSS